MKLRFLFGYHNLVIIEWRTETMPTSKKAASLGSTLVHVGVASPVAQVGQGHRAHSQGLTRRVAAHPLSVVLGRKE